MTRLLALLLLATIALTAQHFDQHVRVTYGSLFKLVSPSSHLILHSHDVFFGRGGVMSVTGFLIDDLGSYWQIRQAYKANTKTYTDPVLCGDTITLTSAIQGYFLRLEETQFGLTTELLPMVHGITKDQDDKIDWQIQCLDKENGAQVRYDDQIRLKHRVSGKFVSMDPAYAYTEANCGRGCSIAGQIQIHGIDSQDESTSIFQVKTGISFDPATVNDA